MKPLSVTSVITFILSFFFGVTTHGQSFGVNASAIWMTDCNQSNFFNTTGSGAALIGPSANVFTASNFGSHTRNSGTLILRGAQVKTFKTPGISNVCNVRMYYRAYLTSGAPGSFTSIDLPLIDNCDAGTGQYPSGGTCVDGDQKWSRVIPDGATTPYAPVNLTTLNAGKYTLEVYYEVTGSATSTTLCNETVLLNNGGANYTAGFSITDPDLSSTNPTTCNGSQGSISITGLTPGTSYDVSYSDDGNPIGPVSLIADASGIVTITNLNAGVYADFTLSVNGCTTFLNTGLILSNPVYTPTFSAIPSFCAGSTPPTLSTTSNNGLTGTWNPSVINNQASGSYTFTPAAGQCGIPITRNVTVNPNVTPTFSFGTTLTICNGGSVPVLPNTSSNSISGTWSPATVDNQNSGVYTFTPNAGICATAATFTVTVNPNVTPTFSFGTTQSVCAGASVPTLPSSSQNGITGTWSPATVDNQASGTYIFTPTAGQCATPATLDVTVTPNAIPAFSFGNSLTICAGAGVPGLPTTSDNGVTGSWNPATVDNQASGTYTFTPTAGICATPFTFNVTVSPNITPSFSFGTSLTICAGAGVPTLTLSSTNGITGTWSPATVDNQNSAAYTFTPDAGQCALPASFNVTVNPNITPSFDFGTSLTICSGAGVPSLPASSANGITGTWSPSAVSNTSSGTYTFTPSAGLCATPVNFDVTVNPNVTPTFSFGTSVTICSGNSVPTLPSTSDNGVAGTWSPATVSNTSSGTYTFSPAAGICATGTTFTVTVSPNITPAFSFGTSLTICEGGTVPALPTTSSNGITGTWSAPAVDNQNSGVYTFTPTAGLCATTTTFTVTVNPNVTPTFSFGTSLTICAGGTVPSVPLVSSNGITGTWSPSTFDNQNSGVYTFTPSPGLCAVPATYTITVNPNVTPAFSFGTTLTICAGASVPALPTTSDNGIAGTWSPASVSNTSSGSYTFTPAAGSCATPVTFSVTVTPNETPAFSFGTSLNICTGGTVPALVNTSSNGISGTWNPAVVDDQASGTYTFTPSAGLCATTATFTVTVNPIVTPSFSFGTTLSICAGAGVPTLSSTSVNGITGTWSPATVDNQASGVYTFTPASGQCANSTTFTVTVTANTIPTFSMGSTLTICAGASVPALSTISDNGVNGSWSPAAIDNQTSGVYTFTPDAGICATTITFTVTVNPNLTPSFDFGTSLTICSGGSVPALINTSTNGITGTWSPAIVNNQNSGTYTFTPDAGQCAVSATFTVTVNANVTPVFSFGPTLSICAGSSVPTLPSSSDNGIAGTWSPATINNQASAVYTFTPATGVCATAVTFTVSVTPNTIPTFSFGTSQVICVGGTVPTLPTTSDNGLAGNWNPSVVSNQTSGVYTFTPTPVPGECLAPATFIVTVNQVVTPTFDFGTVLTLCSGNTAPVLPTTSTNGITGTWNPAVISNTASGTYTFTSAPGQCAMATATLEVTVTPVASAISFQSDTTVNDGSIIPVNNISVSPSGVSFTWTNSNPAIGLAASGTGNIPAFTATNTGNTPITGTITITPTINGCAGAPVTYIITVNALIKDVFVPNVFSPNADGKNDLLKVYGNYIVKIDMRIFNQWGEQVERITDRNKGWDGRHQGKAQPVGVYVYALEAVLTDGRTVKLKGYITLLR